MGSDYPCFGPIDSIRYFILFFLVPLRLSFSLSFFKEDMLQKSQAGIDGKACGNDGFQ